MIIIMKIQIINSNKVRVEITNADLTSYDMDMESLKPESPKLHQFLFHIMENVRHKTGFNPYSGQIMVEASGMSGGISLTISRIGARRELSETEKQRLRRARPVLKKTDSKKTSGFSFKKLETLFAACGHLASHEIAESSIYKYNQGYYLYLRTNSENERARAVLSEFCDMHGERVYGIRFIREHGELIADGKKLADICANIRIMNLL